MYVLLANQRNKKYYIYFHYCKIQIFTLRSSGEYLLSINLFLPTRLLFIQRQTSCFDAIFFFSCNTKFLFCILVRMLCHGDIFLLSRSNKNINACQVIFILMWPWKFYDATQKMYFFFCVSQVFYIQLLHYTLATRWASS